MSGAFGGLLFLVSQLGLLLIAAAALGAVLGRYVWAGPRIRRLEGDLARQRRTLDPSGALLPPVDPYH